MLHRNILVINQYFSPDLASTGQYATEICLGLAANGNKLRVLTAQPCYSTKSPEAPLEEEVDGLCITRIPMGKFRGRESLKTRILGYLLFLIQAYRISHRILRGDRIDLIITFHNPPLVGLLGAYWAKKCHLPFIYILYDVHPDVIISSGWRLPSFLVWFWERLNQRIFNYATKIVVLSEGMKESLVKGKKVSQKKIEVIPIWGKPELDDFKEDYLQRRELGIEENELFLLYAGNMGIMHPLEIIVEAAKELVQLPIKILFIGDGAKRHSLQEIVKRERISNVIFLPFQPEEKFINILLSADCCFVTLGKGLENLALPSRAFTFLSAGKPVVAIMDRRADLAQLLENNKCGWVAEDKGQLVKLLKKLLNNKDELINYRQSARLIYKQSYKKEKIIGRYNELVEDCLAASR